LSGPFSTDLIAASFELGERCHFEFSIFFLAPLAQRNLFISQGLPPGTLPINLAVNLERGTPFKSEAALGEVPEHQK
jgi:hypothetical protein